jgi:hypothetical protein
VPATPRTESPDRASTSTGASRHINDNGRPAARVAQTVRHHMHTPRKHPTEQLHELEGGSVAHRRRKQPTTLRALTFPSGNLAVTMEQHHSCSPVRRGAADRDETTEAGRAAYERAMIDFIRQWHRFGGGTARDIFIEFGVPEHEFFSRTLDLLQTRLFTGMTEDTAEYIRKVCRWRLSAASS